jgi:predicted Zn-dependent peptidase
MVSRGTEVADCGEIVKRWRATGAVPNGFTFPDYTLFTVTVSRDGVGPALALLRGMLLHPAFSTSELAHERRVVAAELATVEQDPFVQSYRLANQALFGDHPYSLPAYGFPRVLEEVSASTLYARFDEEYSPGRLTIAIVGPFAEETVRPLIEETFGPYRPGKTTGADLPELPVLPGGLPVVAQSPAPLAQLVVGFRGPAAASRDWLPFVVMAHVLGGGESGRIRERLVFQEGIAKNVSLVVGRRGGWRSSGCSSRLGTFPGASARSAGSSAGCPSDRSMRRQWSARSTDCDSISPVAPRIPSPWPASWWPGTCSGPGRFLWRSARSWRV